MSQTTVLEEHIEEFNGITGEITTSKKRKVKKSQIAPTDQFIKVSKYLNTIFAYNDIPLSLVPISLLIAQQMEFKTNVVYLLKPIKVSFAEMLDISLDRVNKLIRECEKYDIIRRQALGIYEVNSFLFSTGSIVETRDLQAHFDFVADNYYATATQKNLITGNVVRKAVANKKNLQIPGQMSIFDLEKNETGKSTD